jgi:hypothetical protein
MSDRRGHPAILADAAGDRLRERLAPQPHEMWFTDARRRAEDLLAMGHHDRDLVATVRGPSDVARPARRITFPVAVSSDD